MGESIDIYNSALGIGDAVCMMYAAAGAARVGHDTSVYTRHGEWLKRVSYPGVSLRRPHPRFMQGADVNGGPVGYGIQVRDQLDRKQCYCDNIAKAYGIDPFTPAVPNVDMPFVKSVNFNRVVVAPLSAWGPRAWPQQHWARLIQLLMQSHYEVTVLAATYEGSGNKMMSAAWIFEDMFEGWKASDLPEFMIGLNPEEILQLMCESGCVVGNDSGICHYSSLFGIPTIAIQSHLSPWVVWSGADVIPVMPHTSCVGCGWQSSKGFSEATCGKSCSALASIDPGRVCAEIDGLIREVRNRGKRPELDIAA